MSSFNCFKPSVVGSIPHKPLESIFQTPESSDSDSEDFDNSTIRDRISSVDDACSVHSRFQSLRSESPRPEPNVLVRTLKTASLSSRNKVKLKSPGRSYPSPMLSCMKGHSRKNEPMDIKRKLKIKRGYDMKYDSFDPVDLGKQQGTANGSSLSCLVRSHSDSTCLAMKAGNAQNVNPTNGECHTLDSGSDLRSSNGSNFGSFPRSSIYSPLYPNPPASSFGYLPPNSFTNYDHVFGTPHMAGYMGMMTPSSYGTPNMSLGESGYQGMTYHHPSPQLTSYPFIFSRPQGNYPPTTDLYCQQQRPYSVESCPINGGPVPHASSGPRQSLDNYRISASPMPPMTCPQNYHRQNHPAAAIQQSPMDERAPVAPTPARRQFASQSNHYQNHSISPNSAAGAQRTRSPPPTSSAQPPVVHPNAIPMPSGRGTAFKKLNGSGNGAPPPYNSFMASMGDQTFSRSHHQSGSIRHLMSPSMNSSASTPQMRARNQNLPTPPVAKKALPHPPTQYSDALSPTYQLPEFVNSPPKNLETSPKQNRLERLRSDKQNYYQTLQINKRLECENTEMENQVDAKERELKSCRRRADDLASKLDVIRRWCEWLTQSPGRNIPRPDRSPYFEAEEDSSRWRQAFDGVCRLDQKIGSMQSQRRSHPIAVRLTSTSSTPNPSKPPPLPPPSSLHLPTELPPKPANDRSGRHSSTGNHKRDFTPTPSPRLNRPASAPVDKDPPNSTPNPSAAIPDTHPPPPPRPALPSPSPLLHQKARFASRKEITATYLTPPHRRNEHSDEYKRTASENLQAQLASQQLLPLQNNSSIEGLLPEAKRLSVSEVSEAGENNSVLETAMPYVEEDDEESTSTNSSIDDTPKQTRKSVVPPHSQAHLVDGSEDSAIGDTDGSPIVSQESPKRVAGKKPILRRDYVQEGLMENGEVKEGKSSPSSPKAGVRFHPLALLLDAALEGDLALVKKAAEEVSDVSDANDEGITALHNAVCAGRSEVVEFLVREAGADVNAGDTDGWTPLHCAASCANLALARLLVEHGAALHARTLSDHETALEKCDQADADAECDKYLTAEQDLLGSTDNGRVYALFPRGVEFAGPGSSDAHIEPDELPIYPNEELRIIDRSPNGEPDWMLAEKVNSTADESTPQQGLVPRAFISRFKIVRVPPASQPMPLPPSDSTAAGRFGRVFQSPSPIEEETEDSEGVSSEDMETDMMMRDSGSPQMIERNDEDEDGQEMMTAEEESSQDEKNGNEMALNGSADQVVRTAM